MRTQAKFKEYIWLVNTINKARAISFADMDFEITMRPTVDFFGYLMSRGSPLRILSPEWLAEQIHDLHQDAMRMYEKME